MKCPRCHRFMYVASATVQRLEVERVRVCGGSCELAIVTIEKPSRLERIFYFVKNLFGTI